MRAVSYAAVDAANVRRVSVADESMFMTQKTMLGRPWATVGWHFSGSASDRFDENPGDVQPVAIHYAVKTIHEVHRVIF